jgi:hypothetical protein
VREAQVLAMHPRLVVIHRSSFFHSMNAEYNFGASPEFAKPADDPHWRSLYRIADDRLESVLGFVGTAEPQIKFLVYSRGTDANWLRSEFQEQWKKDLEERFPKLKGRITTMVIPGGQKGTFREAKTAKDIRDQVKKILGLPERSE